MAAPSSRNDRKCWPLDDPIAIEIVMKISGRPGLVHNSDARSGLRNRIFSCTDHPEKDIWSSTWLQRCDLSNRPSRSITRDPRISERDQGPSYETMNKGPSPVSEGRPAVGFFSIPTTRFFSRPRGASPTSPPPNAGSRHRLWPTLTMVQRSPQPRGLGPFCGAAERSGAIRFFNRRLVRPHPTFYCARRCAGRSASRPPQLRHDSGLRLHAVPRPSRSQLPGA